MVDSNLLDRALAREGASQIEAGAIVVSTGKYTGRCPDAKFFVCDVLDEKTSQIDWMDNHSIETAEFEHAKKEIQEYLETREPVYQTLYAGCDSKYSLKINLTTELAWHAMFAKNMFVDRNGDTSFCLQEWSLTHAPGASSDPKVLINLHSHEILITGTYYAGEIKKSVFTVLNYLLPQMDVLPMHCSVNMNMDGSMPAVFFGLSGTGKTTLSSDEGRALIGDDEHGWSFEGLFNFEGGCYAKVISLSKEDEPQIWDACQGSGSILENVITKNGTPDFSDSSITQNTRASYDISKIAGASATGVSAHPTNVIFLTCDAFGVLPPVARLNKKQAVDHFKMGYTAKVAGTESGVNEPQATFSHCFGSPFMPLHVDVYADLLDQKIHDHNVDCWLVNTGWSGGGYGQGERMPIEVSRNIVRMIVDGMLADMRFCIHKRTGLMIPVAICDSVDEYLVPENRWPDIDQYEKACSNLLSLFEDRLKNL